MNDAAVELALDDDGIDGTAAVVDGDVAQDRHDAGLDVDLHDARVGAERPRDRTGVEEGAGMKPGASRGGERGTADGRASQLTQRQPALDEPRHVSTTVGQHHVGGCALELLGGDEPRASGHLAAGARDGGTRDGGDPARDRAHAEADHAGVAADHDDALR